MKVMLLFIWCEKLHKTMEYGKLAGGNGKDMIANTRRIGDGTKKRVHKFCLMEKGRVQPFMRLAFSLGDGFPGWHLNAPPWAQQIPRRNFDIHGGGIDLKISTIMMWNCRSWARHGHAPAKITGFPRQHAYFVEWQKKWQVLQEQYRLPTKIVFSERITSLSKPITPIVSPLF